MTTTPAQTTPAPTDGRRPMSTIAQLPREPRRSELTVRMPTKARAVDGMVVACPVLSYQKAEPVAVARMTPVQALRLAQSLIDAATEAMEQES